MKRPIPPTGLAPCFGAEVARLRIADPSEIRRLLVWLLAILPEENHPKMPQAMAGHAFYALRDAGVPGYVSP